MTRREVLAALAATALPATTRAQQSDSSFTALQIQAESKPEYGDQAAAGVVHTGLVATDAEQNGCGQFFRDGKAWQAPSHNRQETWGILGT